MEPRDVIQGNNTAACGIMFCHNEEHIIGESLAHYLSQGIDIVVFDNQSSDFSLAIAENMRRGRDVYPGKITDIVTAESQGYQWRRILRCACDYMHARLFEYEWILLIDADSFYCSPVDGMPLLEFMAAMRSLGYNILDGITLNFYPTDDDDISELSAVRRMRHYKRTSGAQQKIFCYHPSLDFYTASGHVCLRDNPRLAGLRYIYKHYPWVSFGHGLKKIFGERLPRFVERRFSPLEHHQYLGLLPERSDLVKDASGLQYWDRRPLFMPLGRFYLLLKYRHAFNVLFAIKNFLNRVAGSFRILYGYLYLDSHLALASRKAPFLEMLCCLIKDMADWCVVKVRRARLQGAISRPGDKRTGFWTMRYAEVMARNPRVFGLPRSVHFLVTDSCNNSCLFCNQREPEGGTMDSRKFEAVLDNIPFAEGRKFVFSGGGEPLLNPDLFRLVSSIKSRDLSADVILRTNGSLVGVHADDLVRSGIKRIEISVHGATFERNSVITRTGCGNDVFDNVRLLNRKLKEARRVMEKAFCVTVFRDNIRDVEGILRKAAVLGVREVRVSFCRFYPLRRRYKCHVIDPGRSLFYSQDEYNNEIRRGEILAQRLGVKLFHEPMFGRKSRRLFCRQPWENLLVDWDGDIYPCCGGESLFRDKVKNGEYCFGNLLRQDLSECWNSLSYVAIRRTCRQQGEAFIPECVSCHNAICLRGADAREGHILEA